MSKEEAAAAVAAIEAFVGDTAAGPAPAPPSTPAESPWVRAARLEAVRRFPDARFPAR